MDRTKTLKLLKSLGISQEEEVSLTLNEVARQLESFNKVINIQPLIDSLNTLKQDFETKTTELVTNLDSKQSELNNLIKENDLKNETQISELTAEIAVLSARKIEIPDFAKQIKNTESKLTAMIDTAKILDSLQDEKEDEVLQGQFANFEKQIKDLKLQIQSHGGGSMNRQITVANVDFLKRYTDINLKAGSNIILSYSNNDTTKRTDLTISSSGGGGSVGGTVRQIQTLTVSSAIGTVSGTDQVYLANGGIQITMPDATASDTNLYTIKNIGVSSILINTVSAQTIDGQSTIIMPVRYTSIDLISDSANWEIT